MPEAVTLAAQLHDTVRGSRVADVEVNHSPHKWAWFHGDPLTYADRLIGLSVKKATSNGGFVTLDLGPRRLVYAEGVSIRYHADDSTLPKNHQLLVTFEGGASLCASVQMYGALYCWDANDVDNTYYLQACDKPSPLLDDFNESYFLDLAAAEDLQRKSAKALLATEQRVPGLGNGVLQDILLAAGIHPKRKVASMSAAERRRLFRAVRRTLAEMVRRGGRDTEKDLFGQVGGYQTKLSRKTVGSACAKCGSAVEKASYLGGSVYFCATCQPL